MVKVSCQEPVPSFWSEAGRSEWSSCPVHIGLVALSDFLYIVDMLLDKRWAAAQGKSMTFTGRWERCVINVHPGVNVIHNIPKADISVVVNVIGKDLGVKVD